MHEVRRLLVGDYELRYDVINLIRLWHTREHR